MFINRKKINLLNVILNYPDLDYNLFLLMNNWEYVILSNNKNSFYNKPKGNGYTEPGTIRVSNHWNYTTKTGLHSKTDIEVWEGWAVGEYNHITKVYKITKQFLIESGDIDKHTLLKKLFILGEKRKRALEKDIRAEHEYIRKYYSLLEEYSDIDINHILEVVLID